MVHHDPKTHCRVVRAIARASYAATTTEGTGFTKTGFDYALFILDCGTLGTSATVDVTIEHSDTLADGATWSAISGAAFGQKVKASHDDALAVAQVKLAGKKKFLRAVLVVGANSSVVGVTCVLMEADRSEGVGIAQGGSEAVAAPTAVSGAGSYEFSV